MGAQDWSGHSVQSRLLKVGRVTVTDVKSEILGWSYKWNLYCHVKRDVDKY